MDDVCVLPRACCGARVHAFSEHSIFLAYLVFPPPTPILSPRSSTSSPSSSPSPFASSDSDSNDSDYDSDEEEGAPQHTDKFDARHIRRAMLEPEYLVDVFNLPRNEHTMAAATRVVEAFREEAEGRYTAEGMPPTLETVFARLEGVLAEAAAKTAKRAASRAAAKSGGGAAAPNADADASSGSDSVVTVAFATETLAALRAAPLGALQATRELLCRAATLSLPDAMTLEYRALVRVVTGRASLAGGSGGSSSVLDVAGLFAPLPDEADELGGVVAPRKAAVAAAKAREAEMAAWEAKLEGEYINGTMTGEWEGGRGVW